MSTNNASAINNSVVSSKSLAREPSSRRRQLVERFSRDNPDFDGDDDEALYGSMLDQLKKDDETAAQRKRFNEAIASSDIAPEMMSGLLSGKNADGTDFDLADYLFDKHLDFFMDYLEDKKGAKEKLAERRAARKKAQEEDAKFQSGMNDRIKKEDAELDKALRESGYRADQVKGLIDWIYDADNGFVARASRFELKKDDFIRLFHIKDWDLKLKESAEDGYRRGRNERIDMFAHDQKRRRSLPPDQGGGPGSRGEDSGEDRTLSSLERMKDAFVV